MRDVSWLSPWLLGVALRGQLWSFGIGAVRASFSRLG